MATTAWGIVKEGRVVPSTPLPEGAHVEIRVVEPTSEIPDELWADFEAWDRASVNTLEMVERLAQEGMTDDRR